MKQQLKGSLYLLLATMIWGSTFIAQSVGMDYIGPFTFQAVRCFMGVLAMLVLILIADRFKKDGLSFLSRWKDKKLWKAGFLCGIPLFLACNLQQVGLVNTDPGKSAFLTAMYILFVPIIGIFRKEKPTKLMPLSLLLAVVGLYFLSCMGVTSVSIDDILLLECALMFAVQITIVDLFAKDLDPLRLNLIQALVCAVLSAVVMLITERPTWVSIGRCWFPLAYAGILSMGVAYSLQIIGQKSLKPSLASLIMSLESVFAVIFGFIVLRDYLTLWEGIGSCFVFAAVILSQIPTEKKQEVS